MTEDTLHKHPFAANSQSPGLPHVEDLYRTWFLEYASYVILDRAVPDIRDGLKPVQRRILYALQELDDGRLNKAANVIGHTMRYHPHGDMAIEDALVKLAQKDLLIDTQGNWGNLFTGDRAAAPRYIECRLSPFGKDVLFHDELTDWQASYDGRNKEPLVLPVRFPLLLALGVEGIAVGLATKILPHNVRELCEAAIAYLEGREFVLYPDFPTGGLADFSDYKDGQRGGRSRVRARIEVLDTKTLQIIDLPFGITNSLLIDSIVAANEKGKIKIKRIEDHTSQRVDIRVMLPSGVSADQTIEALYAFTDCEVSIASHACVIKDQKPYFCSVTDLLIDATERTRSILQRELELLRQQVQVKIRKATLERIFIEAKIYRKLEDIENWEQACDVLRKAFRVHLKPLGWELLEEDCEFLLEIRFKRLTRFDALKADGMCLKLRLQLDETETRMLQLTAHTIDYFKSIAKRFAGEERRTVLAKFGELKTRDLILANQKMFVQRAEGFLGTSLKKDEWVADCSELDDVLVLSRKGEASLWRVAEKIFVGEDIFYLTIWPTQPGESYLHLVYRDQNTATLWARRQRLSSMQREKRYEMLKQPGELVYARVLAQGKSDWLAIERESGDEPWCLNLSELPIESRTHWGQKLSLATQGSFRVLGDEGPSLREVALGYDARTLRWGPTDKASPLVSLPAQSLIFLVTQSGRLSIILARDSQQLDSPLIAWGLFRTDLIFTAVSARGANASYSIRRWRAEDLCLGSVQEICDGDSGDKVLWFSAEAQPLLKLNFKAQGGKRIPPEYLSLADCVPIRGLQAPSWRLQRDDLEGWESVTWQNSTLETSSPVISS